MTTKTYARIQSYAHRILAEIFYNGGLAEDSYITPAEGSGIRVEIRVTKIRHCLTDCERDLLILLCSATKAMTQREVFAAAQEAEYFHGESTMRHALSDLRKRGLIDVESTKGGYRITSAGEDLIRTDT